MNREDYNFDPMTGEKVIKDDYNFDPMTGEKIIKDDYNFDPMTGEKIVKTNEQSQQFNSDGYQPNNKIAYYCNCGCNGYILAGLRQALRDTFGISRTTIKDKNLPIRF